VKSAYEPQDGWCPWLATLGYTDSSAIETVQRPSFTKSCLERVTAAESGETQDGRARQNVLVVGEEKAMKRELGRVTPVEPKGSTRCRGPRESQERRRDETSLPWFRAEQVVERVRNPEDGRCWRVEPPGYTGRLILSRAVGNGTPGEVHSHAHAGAVEE